jgi:hypothetical protein
MALPDRRDVQGGFRTNVHANKEYVYGFFSPCNPNFNNKYTLKLYKNALYHSVRLEII